MNTKELISLLKTKTNEEIYNIIISNYNLESENWYEVFDILKKVSLKRKYNNMLADFYFKGRSFPSNKPYEVFSNKIKISKWIELIESNKENTKNYFFTLYNILPLLYKKAVLDEDIKILEFYKKELEKLKR